MRTRFFLVLLAGLFASGSRAGGPLAATGWTTLAKGVEYRTFVLEPGAKAPGTLHVVRIDAATARLALGLASRDKRGKRTTRQWCRDLGAVAVINAGMFQHDDVSNVGRLVNDDHVNQRAWNDYRSALVFGPSDPKAAPARLLDLDGGHDAAAPYRSVVQNLRLIKAPGRSVWKSTGRAWSEAAVAQDDAGHVLFLFSRAGYEMTAWTKLVLDLPLHVTAAMHVEGGPEASLSLCTASPALHLAGSFETGFNANDANPAQWPIPNVLAVLPAR
jgi:Phosphodiester glycosidase